MVKAKYRSIDVVPWAGAEREEKEVERKREKDEEREKAGARLNLCFLQMKIGSVHIKSVKDVFSDVQQSQHLSHQCMRHGRMYIACIDRFSYIVWI